MNWKRRLELICGVTVLVPAIIVLILGFRIENAAAQINQESAFKGFALWFAFYGLPSLLLLLGSYAHAVKRRAWGRLLLIFATLFLTVWFFLSLALVVWSGLFLPAVLLTVFAIVTSITSLFVRGQT